MICLGIESTAHTFGVGIVSEKEVLSNVRDSYTTEKGGIIPNDAAKHHEEVRKEVVRKAIEEAKVDKIDLVSVVRGPGIAPCLHVGMRAAREIAEHYKVPLISCNHCVAHLSIGKFYSKAKDPILLYASGANTQVISLEGNRYRCMGETLDQGVGNFLDSFARYIGLGFPGGPKIELMARKGKNFIELPYVVKGMDVSFSGILTNLKVKFDSKKFKVDDLAYSLQETAFAMLVEVAERALAHTGKNELVTGGGVACNKRLQEMCRIMCEERGAKFFSPPNSVLVDNGVMIAHQGLIEFLGGRKDKEVGIKPYERTDDVDVSWL